MSAWQRWSTEDHEAEKYEFWLDAVRSGVVESELSVDSRASFHGTMFSRRLSDIQLVNFANTPHKIERSSAQARKHGDDKLILSLQCKGYALLAQNGVRQHVAQGEFGLINPGAAFKIDFPTNVSRRLIILPRRFFSLRSPVLKALDRPLKLSADSRLGPVLTETMLLLTDAETSLDDHVVSTLMTSIVELLCMEVNDRYGLGAPPKGMAELSFDTIRKFISLHLTDPELSPAMVARACRVSVRTLHRLFSRYGNTGFENHVIGARLTLSEQMLKTPQARSVSEVAYACGFNNVSHFAKRFAERFGMSPVQLLRMSATAV
jgi:AraC family transcriptional regulator, positive regulator of tynA and feaB